jgi:DNA-binding CsgD family transcriptional regulator
LAAPNIPPLRLIDLAWFWMPMTEHGDCLDQGLLMRIFSLTPAEARLAALMVEGKSLEAAAEKLAVKRETARNQLKAIFAKTETNRQGQLVALLSSLCSPV